MNQKSPSRPQAATQGRFDPGVIEQLRQDSLQDNGTGPGRAVPDVPLAQHVNHTPFWSQYYQSVDCEGEVFHTVVTRVGYDMRTVRRGPVGGPLGYASEPPALAMGDEFAQPDQLFVLWRLHSGPMIVKNALLDTLVVNLAAQRIDAVYRSVMSARAGVRVAETRLELAPPAAQARLNALERHLRRIWPERGLMADERIHCRQLGRCQRGLHRKNHARQSSRAATPGAGHRAETEKTKHDRGPHPGALPDGSVCVEQGLLRV